MKLRAFRSLVGFGVVVAGIFGQTALAASSGGPTTKPAPSPAAAKAPAKAEPKKEEPMGTIEGIEIKRGSGYLGIQLVGGNFKLSFYDAKKKPVVADVSRAVLRWPVAYRELDERTVLNPSGDGKSLTSEKIVRAPHTFKLFITLLAGANDKAGANEEAGSETFVVDFKG
jgi:hypothetical protein